MAARKQLRTQLNDILVAAREQSWKYGRCGMGGGGMEVAELESYEESDGPQYAGTETGDTQVGK